MGEPSIGISECEEGTTGCDGERCGREAERIGWRAAPILRQKGAEDVALKR
jgi:hypothetical protein